MKLIDKDKVVAEIERRIASLQSIGSDDYLHDYFPKQFAMMTTLKSLKLSIDTIEAKEVNLEKEFYDFLDTLIGKDNGHLSEDELFRIAEHFYELGLTQKGE